MGYSLNRQQIIGRVGHTPEKRATPNGDSVTRFSVATTEKYGETEKTTWHTVIAWKGLADYIADKVPKGALIFVEGPTNHREWEGKDGAKRTATEVTALNFQLLSVPDGSRKSEPKEAPKAEPGKEVKPNDGPAVTAAESDDGPF